MSVRHRKLEVKPTIKVCLVRFRRLQLHTIHALFMADTFFTNRPTYIGTQGYSSIVASLVGHVHIASRHLSFLGARRKGAEKRGTVTVSFGGMIRRDGLMRGLM
jgi:hypothetical protein